MNRHLRNCTICLSLALVAACGSYDFTVNDKVVYTPDPLFSDFDVPDKALRECIREAINDLRQRFSLDAADPELWQEVKFQYLGLLYRHRQPELAETFYNSVFVGLFERHYYHNDNIFVRPAVSTERIEGEAPPFRSYYPTQDGWRVTLGRILDSIDLGLPLQFTNFRD